MGRLERFARYEFAPWPDEGLRAVVDAFARPVVRRVEQRWDGAVGLVVEVMDADVPEAGRPVVRLSWDSFHATVFALEVYDEFYSGPYARAYAWRRDTPRAFVHEIVNFPNPWIEELLADNPDVGVFPSYGPPVAARLDTRALNPSWPEPTGRFYRPGDQLAGSLDLLLGEPRTPEEWAEAQTEGQQRRRAWEAEQRARPRYRHLFIASNSGMVEVLCAGLPRWEVVPAG